MVSKPLYVWPFILVYKLVSFILRIPILFIRFFSLGFFFTLYFFINIIITSIGYLIKYLSFGIIYCCYFLYQFAKIVARLLKYTLYGFIFPPIVIYNRLNGEEAKENRRRQKALRIAEENKLKLEKAKEIEKQRKLKEEKEQALKREREKALAEKSKIDKALTINKEKQEKLIANIDQEKIQRIEEAKEREGVLEREITDEQINKRKAKLEAIEAKKQAKADKIAERARLIEEKKQVSKEKKRKREDDVYVNENVTIEKVKFADKINNFLAQVRDFPGKIKKSISASYNNLSIVRNIKNQKDISRQALLINFEGEDARKNDKKVIYEYVGKNSDGKLVKGYFEAFSKVEVHSFLLSEGFEVYSIKTNKLIQFLHGKVQGNRVKIKTKDLIFFITQLSTYIKAGIPLVDSLKILSRQYKNKTYQRIFRSIIYDLTMGDNFSDALTKQGEAFPKLLINMVKVSEMTGELPEALDDMADYFTEIDKTRKQMVTAMLYPSIILVIALAVVTFIMVFVVPRFVDIYASIDNARLPGITRFVINLSNFLEKNYIWLILGIIVIVIIYRYLYKNVTLFRTLIQWLLMHMPVIGNVMVFNEITMFTKTFCSLLKHNVFITDSMEILNKITKNEIYKMIILDTITNLARGEKISLAFKDHWAIPIPAYEMIVTGERTGQLPEMMGKVSNYYQEMHKNSVAHIKTFIEPVLILFLTVVVGIIVLSVIIPMFGMYGVLGI